MPSNRKYHLKYFSCQNQNPPRWIPCVFLLDLSKISVRNKICFINLTEGAIIEKREINGMVHRPFWTLANMTYYAALYTMLYIRYWYYVYKRHTKRYRYNKLFCTYTSFFCSPNKGASFIQARTNWQRISLPASLEELRWSLILAFWPWTKQLMVVL